ncbi:CvpA family protein [Halanaerobaculum tunisiense]
MGFNVVDGMILLLGIIFFLKGYNFGLIEQLTTIISILLGIYVAADQYKVLASFLHQKFSFTMQVANLFSFAIIILIIGIIVNYLGQAINHMFDLLSLSVIDNLGGAVFGLVKGSLVIYILILLLARLGDYLSWQILQQQVNQSYFASIFLQFNLVIEEKINHFIP